MLISRFRLGVVWVLTIAGFAVQVHAAPPPPPGGVKLSSSRDFFSYYDGRAVRCSIDSKDKLITGKRKGQYFIPDSYLEKEQKKLVKRLSGALKTKAKAKLTKMKTARAGKEAACDEVLNPPPTPTATPTPTPPPFDEYTDPLTEQQVRTLFQRWAFAPSSAQLTACTGQTAAYCWDNVLTIYDANAQATTYQAASAYFDADINPILDDYLTDGGVISLAGLQNGMAYLLHNTPNQYHTKLALELLQHHFAIVFDTLGTGDANERIAERYFKKLLNHAVNGDIKLMVKDMVLDPSLQRFLDGVSNTAAAPNENLAREFWERYTIGQKDPLDPVNSADQYDNLSDIPQLSKAFTGWVAATELDPETNRNEVFLQFRLSNFAEGSKLIFQGKPQEATIETIWDAMNVAIEHPSFTRYWAREILERYVNKSPDAAHIIDLAATLQSDFDLHAAIRKAAISKYSIVESRGAVFKECLDRLFTFTRSFKEINMPVNYNELRQAMINCQQEPANSSQGPFGWHHLRWSNTALVIANSNDIADRVLEPANGTAGSFLFSNFLTPMPVDDRSDPYKVIDHFAKVLNVTLSSAQRTAMYSYLTIQANAVDPITDQPTTFTLFPWDVTNEVKIRRGVAGVLWMLAGSSQYGVK